MTKVLSRSLKTLVGRLRILRNPGGPKRGRLKQLVSQSDLFDPKWYLQRYPDVARAGLDPLKHFVMHGGAEGRSPGPRFDARWYLRRNVDVARSGANPLVHYLEHGRHEGRSIKAVQPDRNDDADLAEAGKAQRFAAAVTAEPYSNEYDASWQANPQAWRQLGDRTGGGEEAGRQDHRGPALLAEVAEGTDHTRIDWFLATVPGAAALAASPLQQADPATLGLDLLSDGWFAHARKLMLRVGGEVSGATRVVAFQADGAGAICRIAEQPAVGPANLVGLSLTNPLSPILLVWLGLNGRVVGSALLLFPSLFRGGLHHAEMLAFSALHPQPDAIPSYMAELAAGFFQAGPLLLSQINVHLRGANGSEHVFQPAVAAALRCHFGVDLVAAGEATGSSLVADRLGTAAAAPAIAARRAGGAELLLPADCLPSLIALCAARNSERIGASSFCIVPDTKPAEATLATLPSPTAAMRQLSHPALPLPQPGWQAGSECATPARQAGLPSAVRTMNDTVWQVDPLMPLSLDLAWPWQAEPATLPNLHIVVTHSATQTQLNLCLRAIAAQLEIQVSRITIITDKPDVTVPLDLPVPIEFGTFLAGVRDAHEGPGQESVLVFIDTSVFPYDRRTLNALGRLCSAEGVGMASCAVVSSSPEEGAEEAAQVPWVADCTDQTACPAGRTIANLIPAATFAVAAGDPRILAARAELWEEFQSFKQALEPAELALALANHCHGKGLLTVATTLVRVATNSADPSLRDIAPAIAAAFAEDSLRKRATHLIRLMP